MTPRSPVSAPAASGPSRRRGTRAAVTLLSLLSLPSLMGASGVALDVLTASGAPGTALARAAVSRAGTERVGSVLGLGDSVPAGSACDCEGFVALVRDGLARRQGTPVGGANLAVPGLTSEGLLDLLDDDAVRTAVADADLTIITIGANDFDPALAEEEACGPRLACHQDALARLRTGVDAVLAKVRALHGPGGRVVLTGYWNVFLDGAAGRARGPAYVAGADRLTVAVNGALAASAAGAGALYADLYTAFKGPEGARDVTGLLAADGDHPAASGHALIAETVLAVLADADAAPQR
ncbi:SGNH/GDSL hydrolase family protein [Sphaerisporangium siamense]|uniref:Lysophospholipase L1-like esterase n=1 Tax=Sphaerisporangium siamense TaxID=795645 RepID=A0A7W7D865_9ACTN|nr:SGNH/GDSL hydrolase family protein [Sphaerisporangium siamense]MBB4701809.1 lysophospholipase L1-like esterase [Sphaerisporangium siamense]